MTELRAFFSLLILAGVYHRTNLQKAYGQKAWDEPSSQPLWLTKNEKKIAAMIHSDNKLSHPRCLKQAGSYLAGVGEVGTMTPADVQPWS